MDKLFETHDKLLERFKSFGDKAGDMLDFLECKLQQKGYGTILDAYDCRPDTGTHGLPIFSGKFSCTNGNAQVTCVYRKCTKKSAHWAVYVSGKKL